ncbi:hypothetical protein [Mailhella massiliensis]|uniref:Uncharacterized protein n=1 Tax=Mailhella massiliensis TaxID=1903261 RepID=A0A921DSB0_9BACT|nr:hypothetical protein [Mailhella massiliensis]HJD97968.1 hypothetical protein [Mailhella massiliensis]
MTDDFQIVPDMRYPPRDEFGHEIPGTAYLPARNKTLGMPVYRKAARIMLDFLKTHPIRYFRFGTDEEKRREHLYPAFVVLWESCGYACTYSDDNNFCFSEAKPRDALPHARRCFRP